MLNVQLTGHMRHTQLTGTTLRLMDSVIHLGFQRIRWVHTISFFSSLPSLFEKQLLLPVINSFQVHSFSGMNYLSSIYLHFLTPSNPSHEHGHHCAFDLRPDPPVKLHAHGEAYEPDFLLMLFSFSVTHFLTLVRLGIGFISIRKIRHQWLRRLDCWWIYIDCCRCCTRSR